MEYSRHGPLDPEIREAIGTFATAIGAGWSGNWSTCPDNGSVNFIGRVDGRDLRWSQDNVWRLAIAYWQAFRDETYAMRLPDSGLEVSRLIGHNKLWPAVKKLMRYKHGPDWARYRRRSFGAARVERARHEVAAMALGRMEIQGNPFAAAVQREAYYRLLLASPFVRLDSLERCAQYEHGRVELYRREREAEDAGRGPSTEPVAPSPAPPLAPPAPPPPAPPAPPPAPPAPPPPAPTATAAPAPAPVSEHAIVALHAMAAALGHRVVADQEHEGESDGAKCTLCYDQPREIVTWPCGHVLMCAACRPKLRLNECPNCRAPIVDAMRVFL